MQRFVLRQNVAVFRRYLETQTDMRMRRTVRQLLREAERDLALLEAEVLGARTENLIANPARHHRQTPQRLASTFLREFVNGGAKPSHCGGVKAGHWMAVGWI